MSYGLRIYDSSGGINLDTDDFTMRRLARMELPAQGWTGGSGTRSSYISWTVPGYDPATCFILITPKTYASYNQGYDAPSYPVLPTYAELGGEQIAIYTYVNYRASTGTGDWIDRWKSYTVACVIDAVKVL